MQGLEAFVSIAILIMSVVIHEVSHGFAAGLQGDPTAKYEGRLTLNPLKHIDLVGSIIVPLVTFLTAGFAFGWAKPVPYNPYNLKHQRWGEVFVALAGPASNILIAIVFSLIIRFGWATLPQTFLQITGLVIIINLALAVFNLLPIPPLDGSKIFLAFIPFRYQNIKRVIEQYSLIILLIFVLFLSQYVGIIVMYLFSWLTGIGM